MNHTMRADLTAGSLIALIGVLMAIGQTVAQADDAYLKQDGTSWTLGTSCVQKVIVLEDGKFLGRSYKAGPTGTELAPKGGADEFAFSLGDGGAVSSSSGGWKLVGSKRIPAHWPDQAARPCKTPPPDCIEMRTDLRQGKLQLDITIERD